MVNLGMKWIEERQGADKIAWMKVLDEMTDGKIYVEVERARLIRMMAALKEEAGELEEAAAMLQEVQVETFGSMDKIEKAEFILNQMRVMLLKKDFVRVQIASRKINPKFLEAKDFMDIKLRFYEYLVQYWLHEENYNEVTKCYKAMYSTKSVEEGEQKVWGKYLTGWIIYSCLSFDSKLQAEHFDAILALPRKKLEEISQLKTLIDKFKANKLIDWPLFCDAQLKKHDIFADNERGKGHYETLRTRVIQHNLRVISMYYDRITIARGMELLSLDRDEFESRLSELVIDKVIYARIDRPSGVVKFGKLKNAEVEMSHWGAGIDKVVDLIKDAGHLIQREKMIQEARNKLKSKK